jgi:hypothetical protein
MQPVRIGSRRNGLFTPGLIRFTIGLTLRVTNPRPDDVRYILKLSSYQTPHSHPALDLHQTCPRDTTLTASLILPLPLPPSLCLMLFVDYRHNSTECQSHLASAHIDMRSLLKPVDVQLIDGAKMEQASVHLQAHTNERLRSLLSSCAPLDLTSERLAINASINEVAAEVRKHITDPDQVFFYWETSIGRLPLLDFVRLSSRVQCTNANAQEVFDALLRRARSSMRLGEVVEEKDLPELLSEMITLPTRFLTYEKDTVRAGATKVGRDQWSRLLAFPNPEKAAFDCEDGSVMILELLHVLRTRELSGGLLKRVQQTAQKYEVLFTTGQLLVRGAYVAHAYVVAVDWSHALPPLVLESTAYTESNWGSGATATRLMPGRVTAVEASSHKMYGTVFTVMTQRALPPNHFILKDADGHMGTSLQSLLRKECELLPVDHLPVGTSAQHCSSLAQSNLTLSRLRLCMDPL